MPFIEVFIKPPPLSARYGKDWIPSDLSYRPFHPYYESVPSAATERLTIQCSSSLDTHLAVFFQTIVPLLSIKPPAFESKSLMTLCADFPADQQHWQTARMFLQQTLPHVFAQYFALPVEGVGRADADVELSKADLLWKILHTDLGATDGTFFEFKIWVCMIQILLGYCRIWEQYTHELAQRSSAPSWVHLVNEFGFIFKHAPPSPNAGDRHTADMPNLVSSHSASSSSSSKSLSEPRTPEQGNVLLGIPSKTSAYARRGDNLHPSLIHRRIHQPHVEDH
ncbi:hypothetical protein C8R43DRAFT_1018905 [Mycena crocata]|nr:hypothetical protein C8R43DRAFT_1018905 [Mycena crocata]